MPSLIRCEQPNELTLTWLSKKGQKGGVILCTTMERMDRLQHLAHWRVLPRLLDCEITTNAMRKKKPTENASFAAYIRGQECHLRKQILQWRDWGISLSVVCAQGQKTNKLPMKNELERPIRKHKSSLMEIPEAEKWGGKVWGEYLADWGAVNQN